MGAHLTFGEEMKTPHSTAASDFKLLLEAGVIDRGEIVRWADEILLTEDYDDNIAEISLSSGKTNEELGALLGEIAITNTDWDRIRRMLGRMHTALEAEPARLHEFTSYLERLWILHDYTLPADLSFVVGIDDEYQLAESGQYGSVDEIRRQLLEGLARFRNQDTEQDVSSVGHKPSSSNPTADSTAPADAH